MPGTSCATVTCGWYGKASSRASGPDRIPRFEPLAPADPPRQLHEHHRRDRTERPGAAQLDVERLVRPPRHRARCSSISGKERLVDGDRGEQGHVGRDHAAPSGHRSARASPAAAEGPATARARRSRAGRPHVDTPRARSLRPAGRNPTRSYACGQGRRGHGTRPVGTVGQDPVELGGIVEQLERPVAERRDPVDVDLGELLLQVAVAATVEVGPRARRRTGRTAPSGCPAGC